VKSPWVFLTDTEPGPSGRADLGASARELVMRPPPLVTPRAWFTAANSLGLALVMAGETGQAARLMELSIELAGRLAAANPDDIEYGVESCVNRIDLLRREDHGAAENAYRSCYDLVLGRPVRKARFFGLNVGALGAASGEVARRSLSIMRYRSQLGLLRLYLGAGGAARAAGFAAEVVADFPRSVQAGMLHPAEVLAEAEPGHPFLRRFDVREPTAEGDFVVFLRTMGGARAPGLSPVRFEAALGRFTRRCVLRNPRTPLLWRVYHAVATARDAEGLAQLVREALGECGRHGDRHLHQEISRLAGDRVSLTSFGPEPDVRPAADLRCLTGPFAAAGLALVRDLSAG
jgi:hypothetical protein